MISSLYLSLSLCTFTGLLDWVGMMGAAAAAAMAAAMGRVVVMTTAFLRGT
jgi:hypothetical protein